MEHQAGLDSMIPVLGIAGAIFVAGIVAAVASIRAGHLHDPEAAKHELTSDDHYPPGEPETPVEETDEGSAK